MEPPAGSESAGASTADPYAWLLLKRYQHWDLQLADKQYPYIGRAIAAAKRPEADLLTDMTLDEATEVREANLDDII
jgi:hypothetical protein